MPFNIVRNDITKMNCDAIVNATDNILSGSGSGDAAIHYAAGSELRKACDEIMFCETGKAVITPGFKANCKYIIHTAGPIWFDDPDSRFLLESCYRESLQLAVKYNCESIAFPLISSGTFGCPKNTAIQIAMSVCTEFLFTHDIDIWLVVFDRQSTGLIKGIYSELEEYIDDNYVDTYSRIEFCQEDYYPKSSGNNMQFCENLDITDSIIDVRSSKQFEKSVKKKQKSTENFRKPLGETLEEMMNNVEESFSEMLMRLIIQKNLKNPDVYRMANIDKKLFSKIIGNKDYHPSKKTCQALSLALKLPFPEAQVFLQKAGYSFTHSSRLDIALEYFMMNGQYDIFQINIELFEMNLETLGSR